MPSARERFQITEHAKRFLNIAAGLEFQAACDATMLQMCDDMGTPSDHVSVLANEYRRQGAEMFRKRLARIAEVQPKQKIEDRRNLKPQP